MRWLHPFRRTRVFAAALARPGFDPNNVLYELQCGVACGPVGATAECEAEDGVVALLVRREIGWVVPSQRGCAGFVQTGWITAWSLDGGDLTIEYTPPPVHVHRDDPFGVEPQHSVPRLLRFTADPAALARFVARARHVLPPPE